MSVLSRLRLFPLNPAEGTAKGWIKVIAAYVIVGPLVGAAIVSFYLNIQVAISGSSASGTWYEETWAVVAFLGVYTATLFFAVPISYLLSGVLALTTALFTLFLSRFMESRTTTIVLLVPIPSFIVLASINYLLDNKLIGVPQVDLTSTPSLYTSVSLLVMSAAAVAASLVSWRIATGPAREATQ